MTESTFLKSLEWLKDETIEAVIIVHNAYEELNRLLERNYICEAMMLDGDFWQMQLAILQQVLFTDLGRIFDKRSDCHSVSKVLDNAIHHPEFFSPRGTLENRPMRDTSKPANGSRGRTAPVILRPAVSRQFLFRFGLKESYTIRTRAEGTATLGSDRSAGPGAGIAGRR